MIKFLFFLLLTTFSWSQENKEILTKDSDTVYWGKYMNRQLKKFDIKSINANEGNLFRLSTYGSIIEIQNNEGNVSGSLTYFVEEVDDSRDEKRTFKKAFSLDNQTVQKLFLLLDSSLVKEIPSDKYIKNWEHGFDGITYFFEIKNDNKKAGCAAQSVDYTKVKINLTLKWISARTAELCTDREGKKCTGLYLIKQK